MSNALANVQSTNAAPPTMAAIIQRMAPEIQRALPKHMDGDRMARLAITALRTTPKLADCSPESFVGSLLTAAAMGLEPNVSGESYLVPYKGECTLIVGYQGFVKLFYQSPLAKHIDAQTVYANDEFDYGYGLTPHLSHKPALGDRGAIKAYYAVATLTTGASGFVVLTPEEVKKLRGGKVGSSGGIPDPMHWMERKTALRQLFKTMPRSSDLNRALAADEQDGRDLHAELVAEKIDAPTQREAIEAKVDKATGEVLEGELEDPNSHWDTAPQDSGSEA